MQHAIKIPGFSHLKILTPAFCYNKPDGLHGGGCAISDGLHGGWCAIYVRNVVDVRDLHLHFHHQTVGIEIFPDNFLLSY